MSWATSPSKQAGGLFVDMCPKKNKNLYVWGKFPLSEILAEAKTVKSHRKTKTAPGEFSKKKGQNAYSKNERNMTTFSILGRTP